MGKHVISFKGSLRNITNTGVANNNSSSSANFAFADPYGWDYPTTYHITITSSSSSTAANTTTHTDQKT